MKREPSKAAVTESPAKQLSSFIEKFDPPVAKQITACRTALRRRLPTAIEVVYDNYNFLVFGFCTTERPSDCIVSLAASAKGVALSFYHGASLPDPDRILLGSGSQNRFVRLESAKTLALSAVESAIAAAIALAKNPLQKTGGGYTLIKSVSAKQRPRRLPSVASKKVRTTPPLASSRPQARSVRPT